MYGPGDATGFVAMTLRERARRLLPLKFARREDGAVTVEAVLWVPVFIAFFALLVDATMIMSGQAQALRVVQDLNRGISIGMIQNDEQVDRFIERHMPRLSQVATWDSNVNQGIITTNMTIPSSALVASGMLNVFSNFDVRVGAHHRAEF